MNCRGFGLSVSGMALGMAALAGCSTFKGLTSPTVPNMVIADLALVKNGLSVIIGMVQGFGFPAPLAATIMDKASTAIALISTVAAGMAKSAGMTIVNQIVADVTALVTAIQGAGLPLPPLVIQVLNAIQTLEPVIEAAVGIITSSVGAPSPLAVSLARQTLGTV